MLTPSSYVTYFMLLTLGYCTDCSFILSHCHNIFLEYSPPLHHNAPTADNYFPHYFLLPSMCTSVTYWAGHKTAIDMHKSIYLK